jgi:outer membrane lipoprotein carrier protein
MLRLFAILLIALPALPQSVHNPMRVLANAVDRRYNNLQSMETSFTEIYRGPGGVNRSESGTLSLKRPGKMRWDYREPRPKLFISDGKTAWFYVPGEQQARKTSVKKLEDLRSPIRYLLGKTKLEKEFNGLSFADDVKPLDPADVVLRGIPKGMEDRINQVLLEITPDCHIRRIVIEETDGSATEFRFSGQKENVPLADSRFRFTPPAGVETVEATEISQ